MGVSLGPQSTALATARFSSLLTMNNDGLSAMLSSELLDVEKLKQLDPTTPEGKEYLHSFVDQIGDDIKSGTPAYMAPEQAAGGLEAAAGGLQHRARADAQDALLARQRLAHRAPSVVQDL